jgi:hypothetical protein
MFTRPFGNETPDWAQKSFEDVDDGIATVLNDPALIEEGISQSGSDAIEEEGVAYGIGYVGADLIAEIAFTKGIGKLGKLEKIEDIPGNGFAYSGEDWNKYFINKYGENNVIWESNKVSGEAWRSFSISKYGYEMSR